MLSRPWTTDGQTFRDRCWTNKQALVNSVNTQLTQMIIRGEAPDKAISAISHQFKVSRDKAGRRIMTEAAAFSSAAQKDSFTELEVERYKIVASFDEDICELCGALNGQVFKMSDYQIGLTAPPFHPWCRCCTCLYFEDMTGERWARDVVTGETFKVPGDMTYEQWKAMQDAKWGEGTVDLRRKISYNESVDKKQLKRYQNLLGRSGSLKGLDAFQQLKYYDPAGYADLKGFYRYMRANPNSSRVFYEAEKARRALVSSGAIRSKGTVVPAPQGYAVTGLNAHAAKQLLARELSEETVQGFVDDAVFALKQRNGSQFAFYSKGGFAVLNLDGELQTAGRLDEGGKKLFDEVMRYVACKKQ